MKDSSKMNFNGFLIRIKLSSRGIIETSLHLNVKAKECQSKEMIPIVVYLLVFSQYSYCLQLALNQSGLTLKILELKWQSIH